jgi:hypothetical protein
LSTNKDESKQKKDLKTKYSNFCKNKNLMIHYHSMSEKLTKTKKGLELTAAAAIGLTSLFVPRAEAMAAQVLPAEVASQNGAIVESIGKVPDQETFEEYQLKQDRQNRSTNTDTWGGPGGGDLSEFLGGEHNGRLPPVSDRNRLPTGRTDGTRLDQYTPPADVPGQTPSETLDHDVQNSRGRR